MNRKWRNCVVLGIQHAKWLVFAFLSDAEIDESVAIPVHLSPSALAACIHMDSAFFPHLITPLSLRATIDHLAISVQQVRVPFVAGLFRKYTCRNSARNDAD